MNREKIQTAYYEGNNDLMILNGDESLEGIEKKVPCSILMLSGFDWDDDLTPWPAKAVFKGRDFGGQADDLIAYVLSLDVWSQQWNHVWTGGYSLAGLFSLYLCTKTDRFDGCVSCSGSLWYDGFLDYLKEHPVQCKHVYLSLGDQEKHTKNQRMKSVEDCHRKAEQMLSEYTDCAFVLNQGNHYHDPCGRVAKGITWMMERSHEDVGISGI